MARRPRLAWAALAGLAAAQVRYGLVRARRDPAELTGATRAIVGLGLGASAIEAIEARGRRGLAAVAVAGAVGFAAELAGVATGRPFGRYEYTDRLGPRVAGVPVLAAAAWALMARPAWTAAGWITARPALRVPLAAAALTAWDVFLDPRMARDGYWVWREKGRYEGIPASNYAGWLATGVVAFAAWPALVGGRPQGRDDAALATYAWTAAGETFANAALWRRPVTAAAGAAAMGAVALPALARRFAA
jgi:putative membrane protein